AVLMMSGRPTFFWSSFAFRFFFFGALMSHLHTQTTSPTAARTMAPRCRGSARSPPLQRPHLCSVQLGLAPVVPQLYPDAHAGSDQGAENADDHTHPLGRHEPIHADTSGRGVARDVWQRDTLNHSSIHSLSPALSPLQLRRADRRSIASCASAPVVSPSMVGSGQSWIR